MALLLDIAPCIPPVFATATGGEIYRRFETEPDTLALAVVDEAGRPVGIVERNAFLARMAAQYGHALWSRRPIASWMKIDAVIADGEITVSEFCGRILEERPSELMHGFIVTRGGLYAGVGTMLALLQASAAETASHAREMTRLAEAARAASDQAQEALAAKTRFLAVMSHEIRTPLNGVLGVAEILRRRLPGSEHAPLVDTIIESGGVLLRLLNDALDLSRAEAAGLELQEAPLAAPRLLEDVLDLWSPQADIKGVRLVGAYDGPPDLWVLGDRVRLRQILNNLVGNALKFTFQGTVEVRLAAIEDGNRIRLSGAVTDSGPGVPSDRLETIFEPFRQTEEGVRRGGAGLGLAVCRQIIERMGGRIEARNSPAGGAVFTFEAPLCRVSGPDPPPAPALDEAVGEAVRLHVLIADDNATNRLVASSLCEIFGCTTECVDDGAAAVEAAASGRFGLILMDIKMPVMDGLEATRRIRSGAGAVSQTPILALTANADPADAAFYRRCGMNGVVEKPIQPAHLLAEMKAVLEADDASGTPRGRPRLKPSL